MSVALRELPFSEVIPLQFCKKDGTPVNFADVEAVDIELQLNKVTLKSYGIAGVIADPSDLTRASITIDKDLVPHRGLLALKITIEDEGETDTFTIPIYRIL